MNTLLNFTRIALCAGAFACAGQAAAASLALAKSFEGNVNFAGTQASLQSKTNGAKACDLAASAQAGISLPSEANVVSATLYWAGSGSIDPQVLLNGAVVTAPAERRYSSTIDGLSYFAAAEDVTELVRGKASFTFGGLSVSTGAAYCSNKPKDNAVLAGFSLVVVYSHRLEKYRTVNLYEGFQALRNTSVTVPMRDYKPRTTTGDSGRFGYIVWEGDKTGQQKGDWVSFAGQVLQYSPFAQKDNAFNSKSSANSDENSPGIDFDIFDLARLPASASEANAVFTTESDRVLLSSAIVALPSMPADLSIQKTASGDYKLGSEIKYTLAVSNLGTRADSQVKVVDVLPDTLSYVSAAGADWTCSVSGKAVSCSYNKALEPGASASVVLTAKIAAEGKISNTAEVSGTADGVPGNNRSTAAGDTGGGAVGKDPWVFTVGECAPDTAIKPSGEGCALFTGPLTAGESRAIFLTRSVDGVAKAVSTSASTSVLGHFALECNNPATTAGVKPRISNLSLPECVQNGTLTLDGSNALYASVTFEANKASRQITFQYNDVGLVSLRMVENGGKAAKAAFVVRPDSIKAAYTRASDGLANPGSSTLAGAGFAEAGEGFRVTVTAYGIGLADPLKSFGRETGETAPAAILAVNAAGGETEQKLLQQQGAWSHVATASGGTLVGSFSWNEAGAASLAPRLEGYLGIDRTLLGSRELVGRFYPAYFRTNTELGFECAKRMGCPQTGTNPVTRASFSSQDFGVLVRAFGRNGELQRFSGDLVPDIKLGAASAPGADTLLTGLRDPGQDKRLLEREVSYQLAVPYDATQDRGAKWTAPTAVYLRASVEDQRAMPGGPARIVITSDRDADSIEGGMMILNGRLLVVNTLGTPLMKTPVPLRAQYWTGQVWEHNGVVDEADPGKGAVQFSGCTRSLRLSATAPGGDCNRSIVTLASGASPDSVDLPAIADGKGVLVLGAVPNTASGNVDILVKGYEWLPSTFGRVTFGQFKSPVIYVREMY